MPHYVYILASKKHGTLYVGTTIDLDARVRAHKAGLVAGFTKDHGVKMLVYFESHDGLDAARRRERSLKRWRREWKFNLIERDNPNWDDLAVGLSHLGTT
ncbi:MAG: GIY-YIG nuclease family protein [Rhodospirillaceae bacterium]|nr:GIY-YIG nuclease family protein [Rhodospirillaceae bacterium]